MNKRIYLSPPHMSGAEEKYIKEAFDKNWITTSGENIESFEKGLSSYCNIPFALAVNSGTSALHLALMALNVAEGDEVICSTLTFSATANPILYCKATPVFVESEKCTWNMSPEFLEIAIKERLKKGKKIKAIIPVHLFGNPAQMDEIMSLSRNFQIPVIEDAAESLGATYSNKMTGTIGDIGIYSFNGNKIITTSGGGALITSHQNIYHTAKYLACQARENVKYYLHKDVGYNYRMSNVLAGIGRGQLEVIEDRIRSRRENFETYKKLLEPSGKFKFQSEIENCSSNRWLSAVYIDGDTHLRDNIMTNLESFNIESRHVWKPLHTQPIFSKYPYYGDRFSESLFLNGLCLPSGSELKKEEIQFIAEMLVKTISRS
ncbi:hypothetical protein MYP_1322 [Sporocytophaga myxococcoides]|uniref:GDP-perosamine synthase n=1 Tax=Sporocytophaga myxococcoides TaxID=153721 RepID=A0A098LCB7_9BACT|nr:aminotransferase class I/II-fold pyridoxal phosphate-dependent enzyme [Sporocytophaga myxococcoides]GAL84094.1 hypothetical protein MYP_1322 [Sporocytophaga myxococcoides]